MHKRRVPVQRGRRAPSQVLVAAYRAANRGRFAAANRLVAPSVVKSLEQSTSGIRHASLSFENSADPEIRAFGRAGRYFTDRYICWKAVTYNKSLISVEATREVIKGNRATVFLRLRLPSGEVVKTRQTLVLQSGKWLVDSFWVKRRPNPRLQRTRQLTR